MSVRLGSTLNNAPSSSLLVKLFHREMLQQSVMALLSHGPYR